MAKGGMFDVVFQARSLPPPENPDMTGKTVVVVGANIGLGLETAKHFARMASPPARLILACRSQAKAEAAAAGKLLSLFLFSEWYLNSAL